jgi:DNA replication and repair protein RecF
MKIKQLHLKCFRNHADFSVHFKQEILFLVGINTSGKTNFLESIELLSRGKSRFAATEEDLIQFNKPTSKIFAEIENQNASSLQVIYHKPENSSGVQRKFLVNNVARSMKSFIGHLFTVSFFPQDLKIVSGSPGERRNFLNNCLIQIDEKYKSALLEYEKVIRSRNNLLEKIRDGFAQVEELEYWNQKAIENGNIITAKRENFINFLNSVGTNLPVCPPSIVGDDPRVVPLPLQLTIQYDSSIISKERLEKYASAEIASTSTLVGPHRDDLFFFDKERNLKSFGSRGEQRLCLLLLKIGEMKFMENSTGEKPILLLDDIFSELDPKNREVVLNLIKNHQTIITTADEQELEGLGFKNYQRISL